MRPWARRLAVVLGTLLALVVAAVYLAMGPVVRHVAESQGSAVVTTRVSVGAAGVEFFPLGIGLDGLSIANPPGYGADPLLVVEDFDVRVAATSLGSNVMHVRDVHLSGFTLRLERTHGRTNLEALHERVKATMARSTSASGPRVVIDRLRVSGGRVSAPAVFGRRVSVPIKDFELHDLGKSQGGLLPRELADLAFKLMDPGVRNALKNANLGGAVKGILPGR